MSNKGAQRTNTILELTCHLNTFFFRDSKNDFEILPGILIPIYSGHVGLIKSGILDPSLSMTSVTGPGKSARKRFTGHFGTYSAICPI